LVVAPTGIAKPRAKAAIVSVESKNVIGVLAPGGEPPQSTGVAPTLPAKTHPLVSECPRCAIPAAANTTAAVLEYQQITISNCEHFVT
jgi:hypothetical protein